MADSPHRVALIDRCVPHFRRALFEALIHDSEPDVEFEVVAAAKPVERIATVEYPNGWPWHDAPARRLPGTGGRVLWQWGAVKAGFSRRYDTIIMMAIPHNLGLWGCALAARLTGKRVLMWTHGYTRPDRGLRLFIRKTWYRLAHAVLLYGHLGKVLCMNTGIKADDCYVIYNSLDYERQQAARAALTPERVAAVRTELFGDASVPVAMCVSRLHRERRLDVLLDAHHRLVRDGADVRILLVGDGEEEDALRAQARRLGTEDQVVFAGACYDEDRLAELISAGDVCVAPGKVGLTAMHALAYGVPVLTHGDYYDQMPEFEAIHDGRTGDFFTKDDPTSLAEVMSRWLLPTPRKSDVQADCHAVIDRFYTPQTQANVIRRAVRRQPANDLLV